MFIFSYLFVIFIFAYLIALNTGEEITIDGKKTHPIISRFPRLN